MGHPRLTDALLFGAQLLLFFIAAVGLLVWLAAPFL